MCSLQALASVIVAWSAFAATGAKQAIHDAKCQGLFGAQAAPSRPVVAATPRISLFRRHTRACVRPCTTWASQGGTISQWYALCDHSASLLRLGSPFCALGAGATNAACRTSHTGLLEDDETFLIHLALSMRMCQAVTRASGAPVRGPSDLVNSGLVLALWTKCAPTDKRSRKLVLFYGRRSELNFVAGAACSEGADCCDVRFATGCGSADVTL